MKTPPSSLDHKELSELFNNTDLYDIEIMERQKQREKKHKHYSPTDKHTRKKREIHYDHPNPPRAIREQFPDDVHAELNEHDQMRYHMLKNGNIVPSRMIPIPTTNFEREEPYLPYSTRKAGKKTRNNHKKSRKTRSNKIRGSKRKIKRKIKRKSLKKRK